MDKILISVIMPVYNSGTYLSKAVESILSQSFRDFELILVDDGSSDGSSEKCDEYAAKDSRVIVIHQKNGGICNARNVAIDIAKGEYIGFSDHDDDFESGVYDECFSLIKAYNHPDLIKFGKKYIFIDENDRVYRSIVLKHDNEYITREKMVSRYLELRQKSLFRFVWDGLYKKDIIIKNKVSFDPYFTHGGEDHDFCNSFSRFVGNIVTSEKVFYNHYLRKSFSTSSKIISNAGMMHYEVEGKRLYETLRYLDYEFEDNAEIYQNQIFESTVLPIIRYYVNAGKSDVELMEYIDKVNEFSFVNIGLKTPSLIPLLKQSHKIGLFSFLFFNKKIKVLLSLVRLRYKFLKS